MSHRLACAVNLSHHFRYAQEIAAEGWRGLRTRMINLHLRFYAVVLFVLMVAATFPTRYGWPLAFILALLIELGGRSHSVGLWSP